MKNPAVLYGSIILGIVAIAVGVYLFTSTGHHKIGYGALGLGVVLIIIGIASAVMKPKAAQL